MIWALHGFLGAPEDWSRFDGVGGPWRCLNINSWLERAPAEGSAIDWFGRALAAEAALETSPPWLVGYSLGGRLALNAFAHGGFRGAVFVSAHPGMRDEQDRLDRRQNDERWAQRFESGEPQSKLIDDWNSQTTLATSLAPARPQLSAQERKIAAYSLRRWGLAEQSDLRPALAQSKDPSLWLSGARDLKFASEMRSACPPSGIWKSVAEAGHRVPWDQPGAFANLITEFFA